MSEQQYRVIADRDKGDDPDTAQIETGDRLTSIALTPTVFALDRIERPVPTTDEQQRRFRVVDIDQGVIDEDNNEVTFTLSGLDEQPPPSLPTREKIAAEVKRVTHAWSGPSMDEFINDPPTRKQYAIADAVLALLQKGVDR